MRGVIYNQYFYCQEKAAPAPSLQSVRQQYLLKADRGGQHSSKYAATVARGWMRLTIPISHTFANHADVQKRLSMKAIQEDSPNEGCSLEEKLEISQTYEAPQQGLYGDICHKSMS